MKKFLSVPLAFLSLLIPSLSGALKAETIHQGRIDPGEMWTRKLRIVELERVAKSPQQELKEEADKIKLDHVEETRQDQKDKEKIDNYLNEEMGEVNAEDTLIPEEGREISEEQTLPAKKQ